MREIVITVERKDILSDAEKVAMEALEEALILLEKVRLLNKIEQKEYNNS